MNKLFDKIPLSRLKWYILFLGTLPILLALWGAYSKGVEISAISKEIESLEEYASLKENRQRVNKSTVYTYKEFDRFYIDKHLESITPLEPEVKTLEKIAEQTNFIDNDLILQRLQTLNSKNKLVFAESNVLTFPNFTETQETLLNPVEIDLSDLGKILSRVEGRTIANNTPPEDSPLLIISELRLEKKESRPDSDVFILNMKLIKREFN